MVSNIYTYLTETTVLILRKIMMYTNFLAFIISLDDEQKNENFVSPDVFNSWRRDALKEKPPSV